MGTSTANPRPPERDHDAFYLELWRRTGFALNPPERRRWRWMARAIRRFGAGPGPDRVLDYGCGSGRFLPLLAGLGLGEAHGFDITPAVLDEVAARHPHATLVAGDGNFPTPLADGAYRLAIASEVIEHTQNQAELVADLFRVLAPRGLLLLTTPNARFEARYKAGTKGLQPIENWLDCAALSARLADAGFELLAMATTGAHWANLPYRRHAPYRLAKRAGRRLGVWAPVDGLEAWLAGRLGRGITLLAAARRPAPI